VIEGQRGTGTVQLNGAAARLGMAGDLVIIISYGEYDDDEVDDAFAPRIVFVDALNRRVVPASRAEFEEGRHEA
jgi:aspartate 1-decarboxylase